MYRYIVNCVKNESGSHSLIYIVGLRIHLHLYAHPRAAAGAAARLAGHTSSSSFLRTARELRAEEMQSPFRSSCRDTTQ